MPCLSGDGKPTPSGMAVLKTLAGGPLGPEEVASCVNQSLPRVRSGLRELTNAGLVEESEGKYTLTEARARIVQ